MQILFSFESYFREMEILEKYIGKDVGDFVNDILSQFHYTVLLMMGWCRKMSHGAQLTI